MSRSETDSGKKPLVAILVVFLIIAMSVQMVNLYGRYDKYQKKEASLNTELDAQEEKKQDLLDYENYTKSDKYVENTAKSKLGLVFKNETIFREKE